MDWLFLYALPNLSLPHSDADTRPNSWLKGIDLETQTLAIVSGDDERVAKIRSRELAVDQIVRSFKDENGRPFLPAVLIARSDTPKEIWQNNDAVVAFRNSIALAVILKGRASAARGYGGTSPTWSDTFDFHPAQLSVSSRPVIVSPAIQSLIAHNRDLNFSHSPFVPLEGRNVWPDWYLLRVLGEEWRRAFQGAAKPDAFGKALFRSLEVAYTACGVGARNQESIHDYGLQVALWVSAIEILAWPASKHASLDQVMALLAKAPLHEALAKRVYKAKVKKKEPPREFNALERGYSYLYASRNRFLHGNPVSAATLFTKGKKVRAPAPRIAAIVYRAALVAYLRDKYPVAIESIEELKGRMQELGERSSYDEALAELFGRRLADSV